MENVRGILPGNLSRTHHLLLAAIAFSLSCQYSRADSVIHVCDQAALSAAVAAGGTITFDCDGTIVLTNTLVIDQTVTLDGSGHNIAISGNDAVRVFFVPSSGDLTLIHLTVQNGRMTGA